MSILLTTKSSWTIFWNFLPLFSCSGSGIDIKKKALIGNWCQARMHKGKCIKIGQLKPV
jgi:hypothetical protein